MQIVAAQTNHTARLNRILDVSFVFLIGLISATIYVSFRHLGLDDAFITYRIAENAATGAGLVYNPGEPVLVTTTPLFTLLLAAIGVVYRDIPGAGALISGLSLFGSATFLYLWMKESHGVVSGLISSILYVGFPLLSLTIGMETTLYLMFAIGGLYFYSKRRLTLAAIFLALMSLTPADGIVLAGAVLLHYVWVNRRLPVRHLVWFIAFTAPWFVFSQLYYGSPFPATLKAKMAHGQSFWWSRHFLEGAQALAVQYYREDPLFLMFLAFGIVGLFSAIRGESKLRLLFAWGALYSAGYALLHVPEYHWYYAPLIPVLVVATAIGIARLVSKLVFRLCLRTEQSAHIGLAGLSSLLFAALLFVVGRSEVRLIGTLPDPRFEIYKDAGLWLNDHTAPNATAAAAEIGIIGYYSKRKIIDMIGLTHPDIASQIAYNDFSYAIRRYWPDYILLAAIVAPEIQTAPWFGQRYVPVKYFRNARFGPQPLVIYSKREEEIASLELKKKAGEFRRKDRAAKLCHLPNGGKVR